VTTYRAYLLNDENKIVWGEWIEAADERAALAEAKARCREGAPRIELWVGAKKLAETHCRD
jgi:hypothetical protein